MRGLEVVGLQSFIGGATRSRLSRSPVHDVGNESCVFRFSMATRRASGWSVSIVGSLPHEGPQPLGDIEALHMVMEHSANAYVDPSLSDNNVSVREDPQCWARSIIPHGNLADRSNPVTVPPDQVTSTECLDAALQPLLGVARSGLGDQIFDLNMAVFCVSCRFCPCSRPDWISVRVSKSPKVNVTAPSVTMSNCGRTCVEHSIHRVSNLSPLFLSLHDTNHRKLSAVASRWSLYSSFMS